MSQECIFCKIIQKQLSAKVIAENDEIIVIQDIAPKAPVHYLIIPKKHISDIQSIEQEDKNLAGSLILMAKELGSKLADSGAFRLVVNNGADAGQCVFHLHFHFLSGKKMLDF